MLVVGQVFAVHQDSFGHPDGVAGIECGLPFSLLGGSDQCDGGVRVRTAPR
jgi:hypothetical protein